MVTNFFLAIDFDGTVTEKDITDAVIQRFARPGWEILEEKWEKGFIGSRECLKEQMSLIDAPLDTILEYLKGFTIDEDFADFIDFLRKLRIPHAIISDGFKIFAERILKNSGITGVPVYSNGITEENGRLKAFFPNSKDNCSSGTCKCKVSDSVNKGLPVILVGDGRSDFCIAHEAAFVFSKRKLTEYCKTNGIDHASFRSFSDIERYMNTLVYQFGGNPASRRVAAALIPEGVKI